MLIYYVDKEMKLLVKRKNIGMAALILLIVLSSVAFAVLYRQERIPVEAPQTKAASSALSDWTIEKSVMNGVSLSEDKSIYGKPDNSIYDVYISVFPTKNEKGKMIDFSAFGKHVSRDHTYNPTLNCNIQMKSLIH